MSFFRSTSDPSFRERRDEPAHSEALHEAIMDSVSSTRNSIPEQYRAHFETLRQEIIDFATAHGIPRDLLAKPDALREAAQKLSTSNLEQLATLFERFEYLLAHKEPLKNKEALEYAQEYYHLKEQYDAQVELLKQIGILHPRKESKRTKSLSTLFHSLLPFGKKKRPETPTKMEEREIFCITGVDGNEYLIPSLEQIAIHLFERRETLETKRDQGFTKLLLVPFAVDLKRISKLTLKISPTRSNDIFVKEPIAYFSRFSDQGKTKLQILEEQKKDARVISGWRVLLFQAPHQGTLGFREIPRKGRGCEEGVDIPRPDIEAGQTSKNYSDTIIHAQGNQDSPYYGESGMMPEDWFFAFATHFKETGNFLNDCKGDGDGDGISLIGAVFTSWDAFPKIHIKGDHIDFSWSKLHHRSYGFGTRFVVEV